MAYLDEISKKAVKFKYAPYKVILSSNKFAFVEGQLGIILCSDKLIKMKVKNGYLSISGTNLSVKDLDKGEILIQGNIDNVGVSDE